jgi:hypothetical protein
VSVADQHKALSQVQVSALKTVKRVEDQHHDIRPAYFCQKGQPIAGTITGGTKVAYKASNATEQATQQQQQECKRQ